MKTLEEKCFKRAEFLHSFVHLDLLTVQYKKKEIRNENLTHSRLAHRPVISRI